MKETCRHLERDVAQWLERDALQLPLPVVLLHTLIEAVFQRNVMLHCFDVFVPVQGT